jgi:hypothetical protein
VVKVVNAFLISLKIFIRINEVDDTRACARAHVRYVGFCIDHLDHLDHANDIKARMVKVDIFALTIALTTAGLIYLDREPSTGETGRGQRPAAYKKLNVFLVLII